MSEVTKHNPTGIVAGDIKLINETINIAADQVLVRGSVLGKITATDEYVLSVATADDGSEVPDTVLAFDVDTTGAAQKGQGYFQGSFFGSQLTYGDGHDAVSVNKSFRNTGREIYLENN